MALPPPWDRLVDPARSAEIETRPALVLDSQRRLVHMTRAFCEVFGYDRKEHVGGGPPYPWCPAEHHEKLGQAIALLGSSVARLLTRGDVNLRLPLQRADGQQLEALITYEGFADEAGEAILHVFYTEPDDDDVGISDEERLRRVAVNLRGALKQLRALGLVGGLEEDTAGQQGARPEPAALAVLSRREREVFRLLLKGEGQNEIARAFSISSHTTRNHMKAIYRKLGVHSQLQLIRQYGPWHSPGANGKP